jgi:hypothetical protein
MRRVLGWLREEAAHEREALGLPARGGHPPERVLRRTALETRGRVLREALLCARLVAREAPEEPEALAPFLQDPHDPLVVETLLALGQWRAWGALPALLDLYQRTAGVPSSPTRRPRVLRALHDCLHAITGRGFATPGHLARWLEAAPARPRRAV